MVTPVLPSAHVTGDAAAHPIPPDAVLAPIIHAWPPATPAICYAAGMDHDVGRVQSEWSRIEAVRRAVASVPRPRDLVRGIGDDAAVVRWAGAPLLATQDCLVEDVHFRRRWLSAGDLAYKLLAVSVSDVAAMGGRPRYALVSLAAPDDLGEAWSQLFANGLAEASRLLGVAVIGGDTVRTPDRIVVDACVLGEAPPGGAVGRPGGRPGDAVVLTGRIGGAHAGLRLLEDPALAARIAPAAGDRAVRRQRRPTPRVAAGRRLAGLARAMVDLSDGLAGASWALVRAGGPGVVLRAADIPLDPYAAAVARALGRDPLAFALSGGEDYELLAAVPPRALGRLPRVRCGLRAVGCLVDEPGVWLEGPDGVREPLGDGYDAFAPPNVNTTSPPTTTVSTAAAPRR